MYISGWHIKEMKTIKYKLIKQIYTHDFDIVNNTFEQIGSRISFMQRSYDLVLM